MNNTNSQGTLSDSLTRIVKLVQSSAINQAEFQSFKAQLLKDAIAVAPDCLLDEIEALVQLKNDAILNDEEFALAKAKATGDLAAPLEARRSRAITPPSTEPASVIQNVVRKPDPLPPANPILSNVMNVMLSVAFVAILLAVFFVTVLSRDERQPDAADPTQVQDERQPDAADPTQAQDQSLSSQFDFDRTIDPMTDAEILSATGTLTDDANPHVQIKVVIRCQPRNKGFDFSVGSYVRLLGTGVAFIGTQQWGIRPGVRWDNLPQEPSYMMQFVATRNVNEASWFWISYDEPLASKMLKHDLLRLKFPTQQGEVLIAIDLREKALRTVATACSP